VASGSERYPTLFLALDLFYCWSEAKLTENSARARCFSGGEAVAAALEACDSSGHFFSARTFATGIAFATIVVSRAVTAAGIVAGDGRFFGSTAVAKAGICQSVVGPAG
jgi:hypothetical protein